MSNDKSMAEKALNQFQKESGWHQSRSDSNNHLTIKNSEGSVVGHIYRDGSVKGTNNGGSGSLPFFQK